ncbi:MAG: hypothetical protein IJU23_06350 [Proteobacteria bacterium]|nr:hypothetical protein [Pseudomonadota bacterium]
MRISLILAIPLSLFIATPALAIDLDDDIKPDDEEHITYNASSSTTEQSRQVEAKFPDEAKEIRDAIARHLGHANSRDLEGYLSDFLPERVRYPELDREYAQRAMAQKDLKLEIKSIEFQSLTRTSATIHTRQIATYINDKGQNVVDDAIISYRWIKDANDQIWKIAFTERRRITAE